MNFREGTRRLALLIGGFGAIAGGFGSYLELKSALEQKVLHDRFERLAESDDVSKERKCRLLGEAPACSLDPYADIATIAESPSPTHGRGRLAEVTPVRLPPGAVAVDDPFADIAVPPASDLDRKEIKTINWGAGKSFVVDSIETEDSNTLRATSLPSRWLYLWAVILPMAGFIVPWGVLRSVGWVAEGFLVNRESS